ncbi:DNA adenine methylase [Candidatus Magnetominusculus xianensis]|uniref:Site-specific DNA-methyltransferase (adenine-specific) n=1 Tax=Candidatus Magnetominusculus xianensis TaxID=1748249 RepID=A0ABR5SHA0_9BACT|nr:Dam family site-specific DNA-(adenine-N6)-methyltransferase [Candidatus Magnetominusculus xianensis]KWT91056.1 DNA adenine methylase [Candidatus Magnetominusculus xianensis]MBF0403298.1 Dam family site-specific DNA-(adenine-N6)-methyltransferase [Nitrospirota bacterium]
MINKIIIPPIKCQGIKSKLVPLILANSPHLNEMAWIEPFMGSGVVGLNARPVKALFSDINPHLINFYNALKSKSITPESTRLYLEKEGRLLKEQGETYYYSVRERFNREKDPMDFLFLSRSCFNGMIRFNSKGWFNVPFCRKSNRFAIAYITKIVNQIARFYNVLSNCSWSFTCQDFETTISSATEKDFIYCDPPYLGRHVDYYNSWTVEDEKRLYDCLAATKAKFILSTWHSNKYRKNDSLYSLWSKFSIVTQDHFYHVGAKEDNRNPMVEALVMNFTPLCEKIEKTQPIPDLFYSTTVNAL